MVLISLDKKYVHLVQKPELCAITCLQMILYRHGFPIMEQEELALILGAKIKKDHKNMFNSSLPTFQDYGGSEGISTIDSSEKINSFFKEKNISLTATPFKFSDIKDIKEFIIRNISEQKDLWVEYKGHEIHKGCYYADGAYIHDGLIESFDTDKEEVIMLDPLFFHMPRIKISLRMLEDSLKDKFARETGFLIISEN